MIARHKVAPPALYRSKLHCREQPALNRKDGGLKCFTMGHHIIMKIEQKPQICQWIGDGEKCHHPTIYGKYYCEKHHDRMYLTLFPEMATYIIEKELKSILKDTD